MKNKNGNTFIMGFVFMTTMTKDDELKTLLFQACITVLCMFENMHKKNIYGNFSPCSMSDVNWICNPPLPKLPVFLKNPGTRYGNFL